MIYNVTLTSKKTSKNKKYIYHYLKRYSLQRIYNYRKNGFRNMGIKILSELLIIFGNNYIRTKYLQVVT